MTGILTVRMGPVRLGIICWFLLACAPRLSAEDAAFQTLFDGKSLKGWDGDSRFWRVDDGAIIGETTESNKAEHNTFLIYRGGEFGDFELRFSYQVRGYNSGVQYRSVDQGDYVVSGYQSDFEDRWHKQDGGTVDTFSGMFFEERGRMFLGYRGEVVVVRTNPDDPKKPKIEKIGSIGDAAEIEKHIKRDGWNEMAVIAKGNQCIHMINGRVTAIGIDEDKQQRRDSGILALQLHSGPPMRIMVKDVRIRTLD